jgi:hypothetical protein
MSLLNRIEDVLDLSQNAAILLQEKTVKTKDLQLRAILSSAGKDLRSGIKDLVRIQDKLDEATNDTDRAAWETKANETLERTRGYLHFATKGKICLSHLHALHTCVKWVLIRLDLLLFLVTADSYTPTLDISSYKPSPSPSVPRTPLAVMSHPLRDPLSSPTLNATNIKSSEGTQNADQDMEVANEDEETFVDAVESIATPPEAQTTDVDQKLKSLSIDPSVPLKRSNSNFSLFSLPPNATWEPASKEPENPLSMSLTVSIMMWINHVSHANTKNLHHRSKTTFLYLHNRPQKSQRCPRRLPPYLYLAIIQSVSLMTIMRRRLEEAAFLLLM